MAYQVGRACDDWIFCWLVYRKREVESSEIVLITKQEMQLTIAFYINIYIYIKCMGYQLIGIFQVFLTIAKNNH
jgi:hypothetical protein